MRNILSVGTLFVVCVLLMAACDDGKGVENVLLPPAGNIAGSWTGTDDMNDIETTRASAFLQQQALNRRARP